MRWCAGELLLIYMYKVPVRVHVLTSQFSSVQEVDSEFNRDRDIVPVEPTAGNLNRFQKA